MALEPRTIRVEPSEWKKFKKKCLSFGRGHNDVIRELLTAYAEERVNIEPTEAQKRERGTLYHEN